MCQTKKIVWRCKRWGGLPGCAVRNNLGAYSIEKLGTWRVRSLSPNGKRVAGKMGDGNIA
jgi:hypothetical protein